MVRPPPFEVAGHGQCTFENAMRAYFDHIYVAWPEEVASLLDGTYNDIEVLEQFGQSLRMGRVETSMALVPTNEMPLTKMVRGAWAPAEQARHTHLANDNARHMQDMNNTLDRQAMEQSLVIQSADKDATERHQQKVEGERMLATTYLQVHHDNDMAKQHAAEEQKSDAQQQFKIEQEKWMVEIIERFAQQDQDRQRKEEANEAEVKRIRAQQEEAKAAAKIWAQATRRDKVAREEQETNAARAAADQSTQNANTLQLISDHMKQQDLAKLLQNTQAMTAATLTRSNAQVYNHAYLAACGMPYLAISAPQHAAAPAPNPYSGQFMLGHPPPLAVAAAPVRLALQAPPLSTAQYDTPSINEYNPLMPQYSKQQQQTYIPPPASPLTFAPNTANPYSSQQPPPPSYPSVFAPITQANPYGAIPTPSSLSPSTDADLGTGSVPKTEEEILAMAKEAGLDGEAMLAAARKAAAEAAPS